MKTAFDVEVRVTTELPASDRARLCALFEQIFNRPFSEDMFFRKYGDAYSGTSLHCLARRDDIAGAFSAVLFRYSFFGRSCVFATAIDLMLESTYRPNVALMKRMSEALYSRLAETGVAFVFSCVREEMMGFHKVVGGWRNIGQLSYYIAPVGGSMIPGTGAVLRGLLKTINAVYGAKAIEVEREQPIDKLNDELFRKYRYAFFPTEYHTVEVEGGHAIYASKLFWPLPGAPKGIRLGFLIDVWPSTRPVFDAVVREIARTDAAIDYLIYVGRLSFQPRLWWRVPERLQRPRYYLAGKILRPDLADERIYDMKNWNINLSNTDLV